MRYLLSNQTIEGFVNTDEAFVLKWLEGKKYVAHDSETRGLNYQDDILLLWQLGNDKDQFVIDVRHTDIEFLREHFENDVYKVFHNRGFDINVAVTRLKGLVPNNWICTEIMSRNIYCGMSDEEGLPYKHSLAKCYERETGNILDKGVRQTFQNHKDDFTSDQINYAAEDINVTYSLLRHLLPKLNEKGLSIAYRLDLDIEDWEISRNGMPFNTEAWLDLYEQNKIRYSDNITKLELFIKDNFKEVYDSLKPVGFLFDPLPKGRYLLKKHTSQPFNWKAPMDVMKYIFNPLGIYPEDKDGKPSVGKGAIDMLLLITDDGIIKDFLKLYYEFALSKSGITTFGESYLYQKARSSKEHEVEETLFDESVNTTIVKEEPRPTINPTTGRLHPSINIVLNTGRMAMFGPNLQQVPSKGGFRECFIPEEGKFITSADYPGQEDKIMAVLSKDDDKTNFIIYGHGDTHSYTASRMFGIEVPPKIEKEEKHLRPEEFAIWDAFPNKDYRHKGKILNFMLAFGGSAMSLSKSLGVSKQEAEILYNAYWEGFPALAKFFNRSRQFALNNGYILFNDITYRKRYFSKWSKYKELEEEYLFYLEKASHDEYMARQLLRKDGKHNLIKDLQKIKGKIERAAGNTPVQGTASDMTKTALKLMYTEINRYNSLHDGDIKRVLAVHDETELECSEPHLNAAKAIQKKAMEDAFKLFCWDKGVENIPISIVVKHAKYWPK